VAVDKLEPGCACTKILLFLVELVPRALRYDSCNKHFLHEQAPISIIFVDFGMIFFSHKTDLILVFGLSVGRRVLSVDKVSW
jgi:hypothetical protein